MKLTYYGHSCFLLETGGKRIIIDPFISGNPLVHDIDVKKLRCDYIFVTHGHSDHVADLETIAGHNTDTLVVGIWEVHAHYNARGFNTHPMNKGGWWTFDFGRVKMVQAVHSSSFADGTYAGEPAGFVFDTPEGVVYFAGDTALTRDMDLIPMTCPKLDLAVLPIGSNFTMDYNDAIIASDLVRCNRVVGCHYDTFGFIKIDHKAAEDAFLASGKELVLLPIGGELTVS